MLIPVLASCAHELDITETAAEIYTLYTIVDESTTPEAIREVELHLNRTMFYRNGVIVKLIALHEDEYDAVIDEKIAEVEAYQLEKKNSKNKNKNKKDESSAADESAESSEDSSAEKSEEVSEVVKTGEYWLDVLTEGGDIELKEPRIDIFLARGYDRYYQLATEGKLSAMDEKLNNEAKALKSSIHSTLFTAAKINKKTYGIPVNTAIGEYTYLVFDKELMEKYGIDNNTVKKLEDLNDYLATIKANEPDVVPLMNTAPSASIDFLYEDGYPAIVTSVGEVIESYTSAPVRNYLAMITRYNANGYFEAAEPGSEPRYAVRIEKGTLDGIKESLKDTGYEYEYSLFANPIAKNDNTIDNVICISSTVNSSNLTAVSEIVTTIYTDPDVMDLLVYGVEDVNYVRNESNQIEILNNDYSVKPENIGNPFITSTLVNEDPEKWAKAIKQNQDAVVSPSLGFTFAPQTFTYTDEENNEITVTEPDMFELISSIVEERYPALMRGNAVDIDFAELLERATEDITAEYVAKLDAIYKDNKLYSIYEKKVTDEVNKKQGPALRKQIESEIMEDVLDEVESELRLNLRAELQEEYPDASSSEIYDMLDNMITPKMIRENISLLYTDEEIEEMIDEEYFFQIADLIEDELDKALESKEFAADYEKMQKSAEYQSDLNAMLTYDAPAKIEAKFDTLISDELVKYTDSINEDIGAAAEAAITAFVAEYKDKLGMTEDEMLTKLKVKRESRGESAEEGEDEKPAETDGENEETKEKTYEYRYESWYEYVFEEMLKSAYYDVFGTPSAS